MKRLLVNALGIRAGLEDYQSLDRFSTTSIEKCRDRRSIEMVGRPCKIPCLGRIPHCSRTGKKMTKPPRRAEVRTKKLKSLRKGPDRRRQIVAAASELFARNGFEGTSIREIAAASGVLSGSLYYHFPSKEDLLFTVHQESLTAMREEVETAIAGINEPWKRLDEAIVAHCRILLGGSVTRAILTPPRYYNLRGVRKLVRQRDEYEKIFASLIDDLPLRADCDRHAFRLSILGAMNWTVFWYTAGGRLSIDDVGRQIALMVRGAAKSPATKK
jgi:TetR/AcrR family transcriptional regulator, cholesterol catabolism regulator